MAQASYQTPPFVPSGGTVQTPSRGGGDLRSGLALPSILQPEFRWLNRTLISDNGSFSASLQLNKNLWRHTIQLVTSFAGIAADAQAVLTGSLYLSTGGVKALVLPIYECPAGTARTDFGRLKKIEMAPNNFGGAGGLEFTLDTGTGTSPRVEVIAQAGNLTVELTLTGLQSALSAGSEDYFAVGVISQALDAQVSALLTR